jgi:hypothetical protein
VSNAKLLTDAGFEDTAKVPLELNVWYLKPPPVVIVPPVATTGLFGVIEFEALEALEVPTEFVAVTLKVYAVLATNDPVTVTGLVAPVPVKLPTLLVTVKLVIGAPLSAPAVKATVTEVDDTTVAVPIVGALGFPAPIQPKARGLTAPRPLIIGDIY